MAAVSRLEYHALLFPEYARRTIIHRARCLRSVAEPLRPVSAIAPKCCLVDVVAVGRGAAKKIGAFELPGKHARAGCHPFDAAVTTAPVATELPCSRAKETLNRGAWIA